MIRNQNFYDLNAGRAYPLDDRATRTGDGGERLPNAALVDLNLRFPAALGEYAFLSSLAVTPTLVTATFLAGPDPAAPPAAFAPLAAVTARRPAAGRPVALDALHEGVGGWVVFGPAEEPFSGRFSTPAQGLLLPRCARPYRPLPVRSVRKAGAGAGLTGVVALKGGGDIEIVSAERVVDGAARRVVVVRLNSFSAGRNVFDLYKGPCGGRPETDTCGRPGVEFFNTVAPDCDGNIRLTFTGETVAVPYAGSSEGLVLTHPLGLTEACTRDDRLPDRTGRLPNEYDDGCTSEFEGQYPEPDDDVDTGGEVPPVHGEPTTSSEVAACPPLPVTETFDDGDAEQFRAVSGEFGFAADDSPAAPAAPIPPPTCVPTYGSLMDGLFDWWPFDAPLPVVGAAIWPGARAGTQLDTNPYEDVAVTAGRPPGTGSGLSLAVGGEQALLSTAAAAELNPGAGDWTFACWVQTASGEAPVARVEGTGGGWFAAVNDESFLTFGLVDPGTGIPTALIPFELTAVVGGWHLLTVRHDATTSTVRVNVDDAGWSENTVPAWSVSDAQLFLGSWVAAPFLSGAYVNRVDALSQPAYWTRRLTDAEVERLWQGEAGIAYQAASLSSSCTPADPLPGYSLEARGTTRPNVTLWDTCAYADTMNKRVEADVRPLAGGPRVNAGLVLNYHAVGVSPRRDEYLLAEVDVPTDSLRLRLGGPAGFRTLGEVGGVGVVAGDWYRLTAVVTPGPAPDQTRVEVTLQGVTDPGVTASLVAVTARYLPADGRFGLGTDQSLARFSHLTVGEA